MGYPAQLSGDKNVRDAFFRCLPNFLVGSLSKLRLCELERIGRYDMCKVNACIIAFG